MKVCRTCGCRVDARNETGYCRTCWARRPLPARFGVGALEEFLAAVPSALLAQALKRRHPDLVRVPDLVDLE